MVYITKILVLMLFLASLNTLRHLYYFIQAFLTANDEIPRRYLLTKIQLLILGVSISYILTAIFGYLF